MSHSRVRFATVVSALAVSFVSAAMASAGCGAVLDCADPDPNAVTRNACDGNVLVTTTYHRAANGSSAQCDESVTRTDCAASQTVCLTTGSIGCARLCNTSNDCNPAEPFCNVLAFAPTRTCSIACAANAECGAGRTCVTGECR
jgi:hypothetical protein